MTVISKGTVVLTDHNQQSNDGAKSQTSSKYKSTLNHLQSAGFFPTLKEEDSGKRDELNARLKGLNANKLDKDNNVNGPEYNNCVMYSQWASSPYYTQMYMRYYGGSLTEEAQAQNNKENSENPLSLKAPADKIETHKENLEDSINNADIPSPRP